jgi:hypothetical protein
MIIRRFAQWIRSNIRNDNGIEGPDAGLGRKAATDPHILPESWKKPQTPPEKIAGITTAASAALHPKKTGLPKGCVTGHLKSLAAYLEAQGNRFEDIRKCDRILSMKWVVLEIGCGCGDVALAIAARNPEIGVIATDKYDISSRDDSTSHYCRMASSWQKKQLTAQNTPLDNLVILRAEVDLLRFIPDQNIDSVVMVNPEPKVGKAVLAFIAAHRLESKIKPGDRQIIVKPYSREIGVMACGGLEFDHGEDWSRGLGFLFESSYTFTKADPELWSVNINNLSPYSKNSTQQDVYVCKDLHNLPAEIVMPSIGTDSIRQ